MKSLSLVENLSLTSVVMLLGSMALAMQHVQSLPAEANVRTRALPFANSDSVKEEGYPPLHVFSAVVILQVDTKFTKNAKIACDYVYKEGICGPLAVQYSAGQPPHKTYLKNTLDDNLSVVGKDGQVIMKLPHSLYDLLPTKKFIQHTSSGFTITISLKCKEGYTEVYSQSDQVGFYCVSSLFNEMPSKYLDDLKEYRIFEKVFHPLNCEHICEQQDRCVLATYNYHTKKCNLHNAEGIPELTDEFEWDKLSKSGVSQNDGTKTIALYGSWNNFALIFAEKMTKALQNTVNSDLNNHANSAEKWKHPAPLAKQVSDQIAFFNEFRNFMSLEKKGSTKKLKYLNSIFALSQFVLSLPYDEVSGNGLPPLDGPSIVKHLLVGKEELSSFDRKLVRYDTNSDIDALRKDLVKIAHAKIDRELKKGYFDFQFTVEEVRKLNSKIPAIQTYFEKVMGGMNDTAKWFRDVAVGAGVSNMVQPALTALFDTLSLLSDLKKINFGMVSKVAKSWMEVKKQAQGVTNLIKACDLMFKSVNVLSSSLKHSQRTLPKLEEKAAIIDKFVLSFHQGSFKETVTRETINEYLTAYKEYAKPHQADGIDQAYAHVVTAFDTICTYVSESMMGGEASFFKRCLEISGDMSVASGVRDKINRLAKARMEKVQQILSQYIYVQGSKNVSDTLVNILTSRDDYKVNYELSKGMLHAKMASVKSLYMGHIRKLCNLKKYHNGGIPASVCSGMSRSSSLWTVDEIFAALHAIDRSPDTPFHSVHDYCRYLPTYASPGEEFPFIDFNELQKTKETTFRIPLDENFLRRYGWSSIANALARGQNVFVESLKLYIPYLYNKCSHGVSYVATIEPRSSFVTPDKGKTKILFEEADDPASFPFQYSNANKPFCGSQKKHPFQPCLGKDSDYWTDSLAFPVCEQSHGKIRRFTLGKSPPLPSVFSDYNLKLILDKPECLQVPTESASVLVPLKDHKEVYSLENRLLVTACMDLRITGSYSSSYSNYEQMDLGGMPSSYSCKICDKGHFHKSAMSGASCMRCPKETYQPHKGMFTCFKCEGEGRYVSPDGAECKSKKSITQ
eukprot:Nk52_evm29s2118 gene=Nk52_evmTU29s2118